LKNKASRHSSQQRSNRFKQESKKLVPSGFGMFTGNELYPNDKNLPDLSMKRNRSESWNKLSIQKRRRNTILKIHQNNEVHKKNLNLIPKLKKMESSDADISNFSKNKESDDEFFKIMEKPRKRSIKKSFKRVSKAARESNKMKVRPSFRKKKALVMKKVSY